MKLKAKKLRSQAVQNGVGKHYRDSYSVLQPRPQLELPWLQVSWQHKVQSVIKELVHHTTLHPDWNKAAESSLSQEPLKNKREGKRVGKHSHLIWTIKVRHIPKLCTPHISPLNVHGAHLCTISMHTLPRHTIHASVAGTLFMLIEHKLKKLSRNFLVTVITRYMKIHYEKSQNTNFLKNKNTVHRTWHVQIQAWVDNCTTPSCDRIHLTIHFHV